MTSALPSEFQSLREAASNPEAPSTSGGTFFTLDNMDLYVYRLALDGGGKQDGTIAIFYDTSYISARLSQVLREALLTGLLQTILITGLALLLVRTKLTKPVARTAKWLRTLRSGSGHAHAASPRRRGLRPASPRSDASGQRSECRPRFRRGRSASARFQLFSLDRRTAPRQSPQQARRTSRSSSSPIASPTCMSSRRRIMQSACWFRPADW